MTDAITDTLARADSCRAAGHAFMNGARAAADGGHPAAAAGWYSQAAGEFDTAADLYQSAGDDAAASSVTLSAAWARGQFVRNHQRARDAAAAADRAAITRAAVEVTR